MGTNPGISFIYYDHNDTPEGGIEQPLHMYKNIEEHWDDRCRYVRQYVIKIIRFI